MWCNQIFALIAMQEQAGQVQNLIVCDNYELANQLAREYYGEAAIALDTTQYPLKIGDLYQNGRFFSVFGDEIFRNPTEAEKIARLQAENISLREQQVEQDEIILENNYNLLLLQEGITDII